METKQRAVQWKVASYKVWQCVTRVCVVQHCICLQQISVLWGTFKGHEEGQGVNYCLGSTAQCFLRKTWGLMLSTEQASTPTLIVLLHIICKRRLRVLLLQTPGQLFARFHPSHSWYSRRHASVRNMQIMQSEKTTMETSLEGPQPV